MFSEGLPGGLGIFRGRFMAEVCMMKRLRFHLNFRYEDSLVSYVRTALVIGVEFRFFLGLFRFVNSHGP